jgi:hypothetical protein
MSESSNAASAAAPIESAPAAPAAPAAAPAAAIVPAAPSTFLTDAPAPAAADPVAPPAVEPPAANPAAPPVEPVAPAAPEPIAYTEFTLPEGIAPAAEPLAEATRLFGEFRLPQEQAQKLIDLHAAQLQQFVAAQQEQSSAYWNRTNAEWRQAFEADPQIGGNRKDTALNIARGALTDLTPDPGQRAKLFEGLTLTGMGNHPELIRVMNEAGRRMQEVYRATGTTNWTDAMKKLAEPRAAPPGNVPRAPGAGGSPAQRRYARGK